MNYILHSYGRGIGIWLKSRHIDVDMSNTGNWKLTMNKSDYSEDKAARTSREFKVMLILAFLLTGFSYNPKVSYRLI